MWLCVGGGGLWSGVADFDHTTCGTAATQRRAFGDNNDGMDVFTHDGKMLLVVKNEYANPKILWSNNESKRPISDDDIVKGMIAHCVSIMEIANTDGKWTVVKDSPYNRRLTAKTEMTLTGSAAGHDLLKTEADPTVTKLLGTWSNCGNWITPWGTYLTCEADFNVYFSPSEGIKDLPPKFKRYDVSNKEFGYN